MSPTTLLDASALYRLLLAAYGPQGWWPAETALEVTVGAVLTQNTAWRNVAIAIANLKTAGLLDLEALLRASPDQVKAAIRPSGFYNLKYERLTNAMECLRECGGIEGAAKLPGEALRAKLLAVPGVGPETADSILLYALNKPFFVVDSYTRRLLTRLGHPWAERAAYGELQAWFVAQMLAEVAMYNEYHALIVHHGKTCCKQTPSCSQCPLAEWCPANGHGETG